MSEIECHLDHYTVLTVKKIPVFWIHLCESPLSSSEKLPMGKEVKVLDSLEFEYETRIFEEKIEINS